MTDPTTPNEASNADARRRHTAVHEAAHAVAAALRGIEIDYVTIESDGETRGECSLLETDAVRAFGERLNAASAPVLVGDDVPAAEAHLSVRLAGPAADRRMLGHDDVAGAMDDRGRAKWLKKRLGMSDSRYRELEAGVEAELRTAWPLVETLADELLRTTRLGGCAVYALVDQWSGRPAGGAPR